MYWKARWPCRACFSLLKRSSSRAKRGTPVGDLRVGHGSSLIMEDAVAAAEMSTIFLKLTEERLSCRGIRKPAKIENPICQSRLSLVCATVSLASCHYEAIIANSTLSFISALAANRSSLTRRTYKSISPGFPVAEFKQLQFARQYIGQGQNLPRDRGDWPEWMGTDIAALPCLTIREYPRTYSVSLATLDCNVHWAALLQCTRTLHIVISRNTAADLTSMRPHESILHDSYAEPPDIGQDGGIRQSRAVDVCV